MAKRQPVIEEEVGEKLEVAIERETDEFYPPATETGVISDGHELSFPELIDEVLAGKWGTGQNRRRKLAEAGFDHRAVQKEIVRRANGR